MRLGGAVTIRRDRGTLKSKRLVYWGGGLQTRVATVNVQPDVCMQYFKDPKKVFGQLFPRIDLMFTGGQVISVPSKDRAVCHATFKMPMPVGNAPAHGIRSRDFVW